MNLRLLLVPAALAVACAAGSQQVSKKAEPSAPAPPAALADEDPPPKPPGAEGNAEVAARFARYLKQHENLTVAGLERELSISVPPPAKLSFDPAKAKYFDRVTSELGMTPAERALLREQGVVSVDHAQDYSMASTYFAIYARDLPVLVTTDSILHALHRSYDEILKQLETGLFTTTIDAVLTAVHDEIGRSVAVQQPAPVMESLRDLDLYVTVARSLLAGAGAEAGSEDRFGSPGQTLGTVVETKTGQDGEVAAILGKVAALRLEAPNDGTRLYGGERPIDYSQFRPRGHYSDSLQLRRYFRAMMWLGRADTGFHLEEPDPVAGIKTIPERERRNAALLSYLMSETKVLGRFQAMTDIVDFMVGKPDSLGPQTLSPALARAGFDSPSSFADDAKLKAVFGSLGGAGAQQIRSQVLDSDLASPEKSRIPALFQLSGQRFLLDSFVLSQVVYDSIVFEKKKQRRYLPSGLDVMAALGNDEAVRLLKPELERHNYSANLLAARRVVEDHTEASWRENLYSIWLDSLRTLDDLPDTTAHFPSVMRSPAWARKQLQTQLASWAELRHDTLLYGKQSYTSYALCEYPAGFVEPYPAFYAKLEDFAREAGRRLAGADLSHPDARRAAHLRNVQQAQVQFFRRFQSVMGFLESIAKKELAALPFSDEESAFLKKTIDIRGGGSGPPRYDGWYPGLIYGGEPQRYKPEVADVHTYPGALEPPAVLEVGTGRTTFMVVAVDNQGDTAVYVGPAYSYYEFTVPPDDRLDDEGWMTLLSGSNAPKRPGWTGVFQPVAKKRDLAQPPRQSETSEDASLVPLFERYRAISRKMQITKNPNAAERLKQELDAVGEEIARKRGACGCPPQDLECPCAERGIR